LLLHHQLLLLDVLFPLQVLLTDLLTTLMTLRGGGFGGGLLRMMMD
jgi:hypothetical protein